MLSLLWQVTYFFFFAVLCTHTQLNPFYHSFYPDVTRMRKDTRPSPVFPYCKWQKAGRGLGMRLGATTIWYLLLVRCHKQSAEKITASCVNTTQERWALLQFLYVHLHLEWPCFPYLLCMGTGFIVVCSRFRQRGKAHGNCA